MKENHQPTGKPAEPVKAATIPDPDSSRRVLADLMEASPASITIHDSEGRFLYANPRTLELHGYTREKFFALNVSQLDAPESARLVSERIRRILKDGEASFEVGHRRKDGSEFPLLVHARMTRWGDQDVLLSVAFDITERRQVEQALRDSHARYSAILEGASEGILIADTKNLMIKYSNPAIQSMLGYGREELEQMSIRQIHHECDWPHILSEFQVQARGEKNLVSDIPCRRKDGQTICVDIKTAPIILDGVECSVGFFRDITERKRVEAALRENEARFRALFNGMTEGVALHQLVRDERGLAVNYRILDVNPQYEAILGLKREAVVGKLSTDAYRVEKPPYLVEYAAAVETGKSFQFETRFTPMEKSFYISVVPLENDQFATVFFDITKRKRVEEERLQTAEEMKDLYHHAPCGYHSLGPDGMFLRINDTELQWLGYAREELVGKKKLSDILSAAGVAEFRRTFSIFKKQGWIRDLDVDLVRKDGSILPVILSATAVYDAAGRFTMSRSTVFDNTDRKKAEVKLNEQLNELRRWHEATLDRETRILDVKREVNELLAKAGQPPRYPSAEGGGSSGEGNPSHRRQP